MPEVGEIIVVCEPEYRHGILSRSDLRHYAPADVMGRSMFGCLPNRQLFTDAHAGASAPLRFAAPGTERQDSVYSGFQVCICDCILR